VVLADPTDAHVRAQVSDLLDALAHDPGNGVDRIMTPDDLAKSGGFPNASFVVSFKIGYEFGSSFSGPLISPPSNLGTHGYVPERPEMRSVFFLVGPQIPAGRSLGEIDMRQIAPTLARILNVSLKGAEMGPLELN
jgi:predicted AlkP superfamily pyrophosphatase or phosphodiesterase